MTEKQRTVLLWLAEPGRGPVLPVKIGMGALGLTYDTASSSAVRICRKLAEQGLVSLTKSGWYEITEKGKAVTR